MKQPPVDVKLTVYPLLTALLAALAWPACRPVELAEPAAQRQTPLRGSWIPPDTVEVGAGAEHPFGLALGPNGRQLVYPAAQAGRVTLWLHDLATGATRSLPSTERAAAPFWSPDGLHIGFFSDGRLRTIELSSGATRDLAEAQPERGGAWNADGDIIFAPDVSGGLVRRATDGTLTPLTTLDHASGETAHSWPAFMPDGRHVAYLATAGDRAHAGIWLTSLADPDTRTRLSAADVQPVIAGHTLLFLSDAALMAQPLDPTTFVPAGRPALVGLPAGRGPLGQLFATAAADVLIYGAPGSRLRELRWVSRGGDPLGRAGEAAESWDLRIAPDGRRVAVTELDPQLRTLDVWIREGTQPVPTRLSLGTDIDESATWSTDGQRVAWVGKRRHIMIRGAGAVLPEQISATFDPPVQLWDWSRDGRFLLVGRGDAETRDDLWVVPQAAGAQPTKYAAGSFNQTYGAFSPNGRWVAFASDESGQPEIYIDSFPVPGKRVRVTTAGGIEPRWRRDGRELYFRRGSEVHAVRVTDDMTVAAVERLFDAGAIIRAFDAVPDGTRFLLNLPASDTAPRAATMVVNWLNPPPAPTP